MFGHEHSIKPLAEYHLGCAVVDFCMSGVRLSSGGGVMALLQGAALEPDHLELTLCGRLGQLACRFQLAC